MRKPRDTYERYFLSLSKAVKEFRPLAEEFAARFEHLAPDADGSTGPEDRKLLRKFRRKLELLT
jgi:hypothetical protein